MTAPTQQAAQRILAMMQQTYSSPYTYRDVNEADFRHLDLKAYRNFQSLHESLGYRLLRDVEIAEISDSPTTLIARTFIRTMVSADGAIIADYYQVKPRMDRLLRMTGRGLLNGRWLDTPRFFFKTLKTKHCMGYESELSNGEIVTTSNAEDAAMISLPPSIHSEFHPYGTATAVLALQQKKRLASYLASHPGTGIRAVRSTDELMAMQARMKQLKDAHRAAVSWVTQGELEKMAPGNPQLAEAVYAEVQRQLQASS